MHTTFIRTLFTLFVWVGSYFIVPAQKGRIEIHGIAGFSNYQGDLQPTTFTVENAKGALGATLRYGLSDKFFARVGLGVGEISADDKKNKPALQIRNLNFTSRITDLYMGIEYRLFRPDWIGLTPYIFSGIGFFRFNPYTIYGDKNEKVYLQPLGTEGQGLPEYPEREMYKLTQVSIPIAGGLLWHVNERLMIGFEFRTNKTFTDYLDDVSSNYPLEAPLLRDRGPLAVELSWRRDELDGRPYPTNEGTRGDPEFNDWFYHLGFSVGFTIPNGTGGDGYRSGGGWSGKGKRNQLGCPKW